MYGVMRIINLAHGSLAVLSAFLVWYFAEHLNISPFIALLIVVPIMAALGWTLQRTVLDRSLRSGPLTPLLSTFGIAIIIDNSLFERFGADTRSLAPDIGDFSYKSWTLPGGVTVGQLGLLTLAVAIVLIVGLQLFLKYAPLGRAIRATAEDPDTAELMGINSRSVYAAAAAIALGTVAIAGAFLGMRSTFDPYAGGAQLIFAFEAVVIGGTDRYGERSSARSRLAWRRTLARSSIPKAFSSRDTCCSSAYSRCDFLPPAASRWPGSKRFAGANRHDGRGFCTTLEQRFHHYRRRTGRHHRDSRLWAVVSGRVLDEPDHHALYLYHSGRYVERAGRVWRPGFGRPASLLRAGRVRGIRLPCGHAGLSGDCAGAGDRGILALALSPLRCGCVAGSSRSACGCLPNWPTCSSTSTAGQRRNRNVADRDIRFAARGRRADNYWFALGAMMILLALVFRVAAQASGEPRCRRSATTKKRRHRWACG